ncbi:MAG: hypothetical protein ACMG51_08390 [Ginsengibacter sp.]
MNQIKQSQRELIASGNLINDHIFVFNFSANDLHNNKAIELEESELKYHGRMYDIISSEDNNGMVSISCIADGSEDYLLDLMGNSFYKLQKEKINTNLFQLKFQIDNYTFDDSHNLKVYHKIPFNYGPQMCFDILSSDHKNVPSPPPWQMFA